MLNLPIRTKIAFIVGIAVLVATLLAAAASAHREAGRRSALLRHELEATAAVLATAVAPAVAEGDRYAALAALRAMARIPRVVHLQVTTTDDTRLAELGDGALLVSGSEVAKRTTVSSAIISGGRRVGTLLLLADTSDVLRAFQDAISAALGAGLIAAIAGFAVAWRMHGVVTRPIDHLVNAMDRVRSSSDFGIVVPPTSRDETRRLVSAFNDMLGHIRSRDEMLARHRDRLEAEVEERTHALNEARLSAERANAAKSDFLATMSHEIRTPMSGLLVMAELLATSKLQPRLQRYADTIVRSGRSLVAIMNDILDVSKIEAGKLEIESVPISPRALAEDTARLFAERAASKGLSLVVEAEAAVPAEVMGDPVRLGQILANLTSNALKFTESGGVTIRISAAQDWADDTGAERLVLEVSDTGIGIAPDKLGAIFEAYVQAEASTTRHYGGTGIGLSICRRLAEAMGGTISVASTPGRGSTFQVRLPLVAVSVTPPHPAGWLPDRRATRSEDGQVGSRSNSGLRVLAADDTAISRDVLVEALSRLGADVTSVANGREAVHAYTRCDFDLVILDGSMPVLSGYDAAREIRAFDMAAGRDRVPILALTGHIVGPEAGAWAAADMDARLTKPFTLEQLRSTIEQLTASPETGFAPVSPPAIALDELPGDLPPLVDHAAIADISQIDAESADLLVRLVRLFFEHVPPAVAAVRAAIETQAPDATARTAHALRSMASSMGAVRLARHAATIETAAVGGELDRCEGLLQELDEIVSQTIRELERVGSGGRVTAADASAPSAVGSAT